MIPDGYMVNRPISYGGGVDLGGIPNWTSTFHLHFRPPFWGVFCADLYVNGGPKMTPKRGHFGPQKYLFSYGRGAFWSFRYFWGSVSDPLFSPLVHLV